MDKGDIFTIAMNLQMVALALDVKSFERIKPYTDKISEILQKYVKEEQQENGFNPYQE